MTNNIYSQISSFITVVAHSVNQQSQLLQNGFRDKSALLSVSEKHGGFRPHVVSESDLVRRVRRAGFGHHIIADPQVPDHEYNDALVQGEKLMTSSKTCRFDEKRLIRAVAIVAKVFFGEHKLRPIPIGLAAKALNMQASSGYPYYVKKGKAVDRLVNDANSTPFSEWRYFPVMRSFRLQFRRDFEKVVSKIRVIYPYPGMITLLELRFVRPAVDFCISKVDSPYVTGRSGSFVHNIIKKYCSYKNVSTDISKFDQNMPNEVVVAAFACLRTAFKLDKSDAILFENLATFFCSSYLSSRVGTKDAKTIVKTSGIPSGTGFTNLIGTLCHAIILAYYDHDWFINNKTLLCSDDNLFFTDNSYSLSDLSDIYEPWGLKFNSEKTNMKHNFDKIHFLGFDWIRAKRIVDTKLVVNQLVYHTNYIKEDEMTPYQRIVARAASVLLNGINGKTLFIKILPDVYSSLQSRDIPYIFLPTYQPATSSTLITGSKKINVVESLTRHLNMGWLIR